VVEVYAEIGSQYLNVLMDMESDQALVVAGLQLVDVFKHRGAVQNILERQVVIDGIIVRLRADCRVLQQGFDLEANKMQSSPEK
jgi:hypothetical protein